MMLLSSQLIIPLENRDDLQYDSEMMTELQSISNCHVKVPYVIGGYQSLSQSLILKVKIRFKINFKLTSFSKSPNASSLSFSLSNFFMQELQIRALIIPHY